MGEKKERLKRKTDLERKFGKKIAKDMNVKSIDDDLALSTRKKLEICEARVNLEARKKEEKKLTGRKSGKSRTTDEDLLLESQKMRKQLKECWEILFDATERIEDLEDWKSAAEEDTEDESKFGAKKKKGFEIVRKNLMGLKDCNLLIVDGRREIVRGGGGQVDQDCKEVQASFQVMEDFPNSVNCKAGQTKMTHYLANINLNKSGGIQNWTASDNPRGVTYTASSQSEAGDSRRGGRGFGLDCDWRDGRGVAAGRPMGEEASAHSPWGQDGIQNTAGRGNL